MSIYKKLLILIPVILGLAFIAFFIPKLFLGKKPALDRSEAGQAINWIRADVQNIFANEPTTVTIATHVEADPTLISTSVNLIRYDSKGNAIANLGRLYDDGTHGDTIAGDNIFINKIIFNETEPGMIYLRTSAAYKGLLKRILSDTLTIQVKIRSNPEIVRSELIADLKKGDIEKVMMNFTSTPQNQAILPTLNTTLLNHLAYCLENSRLVEEQEGYRIYRYEWVENNEKNWVTFIMTKNENGEWKIDGW